MITRNRMRRREFTVLFFGAAAAWPLAVRAQQPALKPRRLALLHPSHPVASMNEAGFAQYRALFGALKERGFAEGRTLAVDRWSAEGQAGRYDELARAAVARRPDVVLAAGNGLTKAMQSRTKTIPIVGIMSDPVTLGLAASLARPGGNVTGVAVEASEVFHGKRLELLLEMAPNAKRIAYLTTVEPTDPGVHPSAVEVARQRGLDLFPVPLKGAVPSPAYENAFAEMAARRADALLLGTAPVHLTHRAKIVSLASAAKLPGSYSWRDFVELGGLMSYAPSLPDLHRRCAGYIAQIFKGARPEELPITQPEKFELAVNLKTAKALGLAVSDAMLIRADEVIE
jgi:putative tryptophan/tyrosine transport system substrate-binding protein